MVDIAHRDDKVAGGIRTFRIIVQNILKFFQNDTGDFFLYQVICLFLQIFVNGQINVIPASGSVLLTVSVTFPRLST